MEGYPVVKAEISFCASDPDCQGKCTRKDNDKEQIFTKYQNEVFTPNLVESVLKNTEETLRIRNEIHKLEVP